MTVVNKNENKNSSSTGLNHPPREKRSNRGSTFQWGVWLLLLVVLLNVWYYTSTESTRSSIMKDFPSVPSWSSWYTKADDDDDDHNDDHDGEDADHDDDHDDRRDQDDERDQDDHHDDNDHDDHDDFALAREESFGFFTDISKRNWERIQKRVKLIQPNVKDKREYRKRGIWFQNNYEPEISCLQEERIGKLGDGGKWVCDPYRIAESPTCLVYSVGSRNDFSFELDVFRKIGTHCEIHTFDMGNYSSTAMRIREVSRAKGVELNLNYHQWGIAAQNFVDDKGQQFWTLKKTVHRLGHVGRKVDIFKIDCEGCEIDVFDESSMLHSRTPFIELQQVLVEVHKTSHAFFRYMHKAGFFIFHKEPNLIVSNALVEYAFIKLKPYFYKSSP